MRIFKVEFKEPSTTYFYFVAATCVTVGHRIAWRLYAKEKALMHQKKRFPCSNILEVCVLDNPPKKRKRKRK